jgi:two-component system alkaline phosphatase synthesis response regulator PhoP
MEAKKSLRILVVDDDNDILDLLQYNLEKEGMEVKTLDDSAKTISITKDYCPDLIILDVMMPHPNGIELCRELRSIKRFKDTYIFFLSAKSESYYQQAALTIGGDDYIEKINGLRALTHKISSVLKKEFVIRKRVIELYIGSLMLNRRTNSVSFRDHVIFLNKSEFELLFFFAQNPGKIISLENLVHNIWGSEIYLLESSVDTYIENLKRKTGLCVIQRLHNDQYRFIVQ